jgi:hypothetical protein
LLRSQPVRAASSSHDASSDGGRPTHVSRNAWSPAAAVHNTPRPAPIKRSTPLPARTVAHRHTRERTRIRIRICMCTRIRTHTRAHAHSTRTRTRTAHAHSTHSHTCQRCAVRGPVTQSLVASHERPDNGHVDVDVIGVAERIVTHGGQWRHRRSYVEVTRDQTAERLLDICGHSGAANARRGCRQGTSATRRRTRCWIQARRNYHER